MSTCGRCGTDDRYPNGNCKPCTKRRANDWYWANRDRALTNMKAHREANPSIGADAKRRRMYNMTPDEFQKRLDAQGGACAICRRPFVSLTPCIDHDHACCPDRGCGECNRGILCRPCNSAIADMRDDSDALRAAAAYLDAWRATRPQAPAATCGGSMNERNRLE